MSTEQPYITKGAKRAVIVLVILTFLVAGTSVGFTVVYVHQFCSVITAFTDTPVKKPADPVATPAQENQYLWYQRFLRLGSDLHC